MDEEDVGLWRRGGEGKGRGEGGGEEQEEVRRSEEVKGWGSECVMRSYLRYGGKRANGLNGLNGYLQAGELFTSTMTMMPARNSQQGWVVR